MSREKNGNKPSNSFLNVKQHKTRQGKSIYKTQGEDRPGPGGEGYICVRRPFGNILWQKTQGVKNLNMDQRRKKKKTVSFVVLLMVFGSARTERDFN